MKLFKTVAAILKFNKALADIGLGAHGLTANVPSWFRKCAIASCVDGYNPKLAAVKLYQVYTSHRTIFNVRFSPLEEQKCDDLIDAWVLNGEIPSSQVVHISILIDEIGKNYSCHWGKKAPSDFEMDELDKWLCIFLLDYDGGVGFSGGLGWRNNPEEVVKHISQI